jgi:Tol biopolymer transport system component
LADAVGPAGTCSVVAGSGGATYAPDGSWIVYRYENDNNNQIWLTKMHPNGLRKTRITSFPFTIQGTAWAPQPGNRG